MQTNKSTITVITTTVAIMALVCVGTICWLAYLKIEVPKDLSVITAALVGALTGMLVKTSPSATTTSSEALPPTNGFPAPVEVVNKPDDPVPTTESKP